MKRTIIFLCTAAVLALSTGTAFALSHSPNCSHLSKGAWAACILEQNSMGTGE